MWNKTIAVIRLCNFHKVKQDDCDCGHPTHGVKKFKMFLRLMYHIFYRQRKSRPTKIGDPLLTIENSI